MSFNKLLSIEGEYRRDSFSARICDDLCQELLQYLALEDRLKLECVSKQFQRNIIKSQKVLDFKMSEEAIPSFTLEEFKQILKKFPKISEINLINRFEDETVSQLNLPLHEESYQLLEAVRTQQSYFMVELFRLITKYCTELTHFECDFDFLNDTTHKQFYQKFSPKLVSLDIINSFPNDWLFSSIQFKRLKRFSVNHLEDKDSDNLEAFLKSNANTIKDLTIYLDSFNKKHIEETVLKSIEKHTNLVVLRFDASYSPIDGLFSKHWDRIAVRCERLKSIQNFIIISKDMDLNNEMMAFLKRFKRLKRLGLHFSNFRNTLGAKEKIKLFSFKRFEGFDHLTHVSIEFSQPFSHPFPEHIFIDIDTCLPNLRALAFGHKVKARERTADRLSRLSKLERISVGITSNLVKHLIETKLIKECKRIKQIDIFVI